MSETSRRRRWLGRTLLGASVLALPLTASISYAATSAQPAPPASPAPPSAELPPAPPAPPEFEAAPGQDDIRTLVARGDGPDSERAVHEFTVPPPPERLAVAELPQPSQLPQPPQPPRFDAFAHGHPGDPEFEARLEEFGRAMEKWGEQFGERMAADAEARAEAWAKVQHQMPEVVESCDPSERRRTTNADGRPRIVLCEREIELAARSSLRQARNAIARNRDMSENIRRDVLRNLDEEIARLEAERH